MKDKYILTDAGMCLLFFFACFCVVRFCACDSAHILQLFSVEKGENRIV